MIEVRALGPDQWRLIREVRLRSLADSPQAFTSSHQREVGFDETAWRSRCISCQWFVAFDADEPVGIAGGMDGWSPDASERELVGMWVAQDQRGRGVAAHLLQAVVSWAAAQGATGLTLGVRPDNQVARATYLKLGLQPTGRTVRSTTDPAVSVEVMGMPVPPSLG